MSYNRGYQQGGSAPYRSNMNQNMGQQRSIGMVNPWQCGVAPNSRSQVQNILPISQAPVNNNMLAQQHALAVASNLLSTLGMLPQQQQHQGMPSLLNLPSYRHQPQNFGGGSMNNRFGNNNLGAVRRNQGQGSYRSEPYNSRGRQSTGQHHQQGRGRNPPFSKTNSDRKPAAAAVRANDKTPASSKGLTDLRAKLKKPDKEQGESDDGAKNGKDETVSKDGDSADKESVGESQLESDICMKEEAKGDDEDEGKTKKRNKREWKDEKKGDVADTNEEVTTSVKEGADTDEQEVTSLPTIVGEGEKKRKVSEKEQRHASKVFACHVCDASAVGEGPFVRHMNSKTHKVAMESLAEQYKIEADGMRRNMQTSARLEELQMDKLKRMGKTTRRTFHRDYCKMCDLNFLGSLPAHRRNEGHLALKIFLHPRCIPCDKEFPTRLEWDNHNLSILHQLRVYSKVGEDSQDATKSVTEIPELKSTESDDEDEIFIHEDEQLQYDPNRCYGKEVTIPGFHCKVCEVFYPKGREHCQTKGHFKKWLEYKRKEKEAAEIAKQAEAEAELLAAQESNAADPVIAAMEVDATPDPASSPAPKDDNEGNWKRVRVKIEEEEEDDDCEVLEPISTPTSVQLDQTPPFKSDGSAPYDPLEGAGEVTESELDQTPPCNIQDGSGPHDPMEAADTESTKDRSKEFLEPDDPILEELDKLISDIPDADKLVPELDSVPGNHVPLRGSKARRAKKRN